MASSRPRLPLQTGNLANISEAELAATASPARGKEMRQNLLAKLRPPAFVHSWDFWHDRQDRRRKDAHDAATDASSPALDAAAPDAAAAAAAAVTEDEYERRLVKLHSINDVREFWEVFNNFDITALPLHDTIHLFHRGIEPIWEDARNARGGSWTFRVPKDYAHPSTSAGSTSSTSTSRALDFWKHIALLAIGEQLQRAVASARTTFRDDICGVSLSVRYASVLVQIWQRDAAHVAGRERVLATVLEGLPAELRPREGSYYYKAHVEHKGFKGERLLDGDAGHEQAVS